ncbi:transferase family-domain-containing protein [Syncephalis fuscata]|nr:transferase family-domain-containing protein [Syncephalis fuscata]
MSVGNDREIWLTLANVSKQKTYQLSHADYVPGPIYAQQSRFMPIDALIISLRKTINQYPIVCGRLTKRKDGEYEVRPSSKGVLISEPDWPYKDLTNEWRAIVQPSTENMPLLAIKITRFANNSGLVMCVAGHHYIADGSGWSMLLKSWAAFARGETPPPPSHDRQFLRLSPESNKLLIEQGAFNKSQISSDESFMPRQSLMYRLTFDQLTQLKKDAIAPLDDAAYEAVHVSTIDVVVALFWRACIRARNLPKDQPLVEYSALNMRPNLPEFPVNYFGNAVHLTELQLTADEVLNNSIGHVAFAHRQAVISGKRITIPDWMACGDIHSKLSLADRAANWVKHADFVSTDWSKLGYYTVNFGEGNPVCCRRLMNAIQELITILDAPSPCGTLKNGLDVCISFDNQYYNHLVNDQELLKYAQLLG